MPTYTDQTGKNITLAGFPNRIVSLVPSQTELLYDLGLGDRVIGITKFCVHPETWFRNKTRIGGTKMVHIEQVKELSPDLIIANKEENLEKEVAELAVFCPVWTSDISNLQQAFQMIEAIGTMTGTAEKAIAMTKGIEQGFGLLPQQITPLQTAYLIWQEPYMTIGGDTFINDMLARCGFENIYKNQQRYPITTIEEIRNSGCQLLLLSSEPFPFQQTHLHALQSQLPAIKIVLVDGEMFSWYGSRLLQAPAYFSSVIHEVDKLTL